MTDINFITYCGLYCGLCSQKCRIPKKAQNLYEVMQKEGYEYWGHDLLNFTEFWGFLSGLAIGDEASSCRLSTCGPPFCSIRNCAKEKSIEVCPFCDEYPCNRIEGLAKGYPTLLSDGKRLREIGEIAWIAEQEDRVRTGFAYVDIRCYPYEVPDD